jgi:branched-chain amino acid transport system permease protein
MSDTAVNETIGAGEPARVEPLHYWIMLGIAALICIAPFLVYPFLVMQVMLFALFALAFNLLLGFGGLLSFGHAAFLGWASYISAYSAKILGLSPELAILSGTATAMVLGIVFGWLSIRRQGIYFAMITLALAQMVYFVALQADFTGGEDGIQSVPRGVLFGIVDLKSDMAMYWVVAVIFIAAMLFIHRVIHSPFGQVLQAIRENEDRATSLGLETARYKLIVFVISATLAGLAGATKAITFQIASLTDVHWAMSGEVVLMTLVGGMGTVFGPIVGALVIVIMQNSLAHLGAWVIVVQGLIFIVVVLAFRDGIVGVLGRWLKRSL